MLACSSDNQSFKRRDFEAVLMMRNEGCDRDSCPEFSFVKKKKTVRKGVVSYIELK